MAQLDSYRGELAETASRALSPTSMGAPADSARRAGSTASGGSARWIPRGRRDEAPAPERGPAGRNRQHKRVTSNTTGTRTGPGRLNVPRSRPCTVADLRQQRLIVVPRFSRSVGVTGLELAQPLRRASDCSERPWK